MNNKVDESGTGLARPSKSQLDWQDMELGMFFHFDMVTYAPGWNFRSWANLPAPNLYNPVDLDTDQWMEAAKAMGAKYAVFVAKHCSGFLQWQSDIYPYGIKQSSWRDGKGDVVGDFVESCHKYGIKPGIYASVTANGYWEVDNPGLVNRGKGDDQDKQIEYARVCEQMLTELWSRYGELTEVWFDGGALPPEEGGPDLVPIFQKYQPNAIVFQGPVASIRWIGNESGVASYPCWATVPDMDSIAGNRQLLTHGDPDGKLWLPAECDVPIRNHEWFWQPDDEHKIYSLDELMNMYYRSVGCNCNLLVNANPAPNGLVPEADFQRYVEFGNEIRRRFGNPIAETSGSGELLELKMDKPTKINHIAIMEEIAYGERIREYVIEGLAGKTWLKLCDGISVGHKRIEKLDPIEVSAIRLRCTKSVAVPFIRKFFVY
jgi:alpha-L-fucosidase